MLSRPLSIDTKLQYARQAAEAPDYAHERGARRFVLGCLLRTRACQSATWRLYAHVDGFRKADSLPITHFHGIGAVKTVERSLNL